MDDILMGNFIQFFKKTSFYPLSNNYFQALWMLYDNVSVHTISVLEIISMAYPVIASW